MMNNSTHLMARGWKGEEMRSPKPKYLPQKVSPPSDLVPALASHEVSSLEALGKVELLNRPLVALFCSRHCPARLMVKAQDWARAVRNADVTIISGFHTPVEKECLRVLLKGNANLIICPARSVPSRIHLDWRAPMEAGRLLLLSFFSDDVTRPTAESSMKRNELVAAISSDVIVLQAPEGSRTLSLAASLLALGKRLQTLADPANDALLGLGAMPIAAKS